VNISNTVPTLQNRRFDLRIQLGAAVCGPAFLVLYLIFWWGVAGFIPPLNPRFGPEVVTAWYQDNATSIRIGQTGCLAALGLLYAFWLDICLHIRDIERSRGTRPFLYVMCLNGAILNFVILNLCSLAWLVCTWTDIGPGAVESWQRFAWFTFFIPFPAYLINVLTQGVAILLDNRPDRWLPRWVGYFCLMLTMTSFTGVCVAIFDQGPLAWNGIIAFYVVLIGFATWVLLIGVMNARTALRRLRALEADERAAATRGTSLLSAGP
jgi:hypothetical protein